MRFLPLLLVIICASVPVEELASTLENELVIRSSWSLLLCVSLYKLIKPVPFYIILCCEFWSLAYNLAIALGYYFADFDLGAWYTPVMSALLCIEIVVTLPGRTRDRDSRSNRGDRNRYSRRSFVPRDMAIGDQVQVASCKI